MSDLFFSCFLNFDHKNARSGDDSFLLLEHGEVWTIDDFVNVVKPADYIRTNYFSVINSRVEGNVAFINYWNKANFKNADKSGDIYWLESVVVSKVGDKWLLSQMHSTRLPQGETPKGVTFIKQ
ncbi:nuclear transport factor 2 family protein (plasmid) [Pseudoalteromonas espejiana]